MTMGDAVGDSAWSNSKVGEGGECNARNQTQE